MKGNGLSGGDADNITVRNSLAALFDYLRDVIYSPAKASLDFAALSEEFHDLGKGLMYYSHIVSEAMNLARNLADGNLNTPIPPSSNEIASHLKSLHSSLRHLTWQAQQVAAGDYSQYIDFMGDFSEAFNNMISQLERRRQISLDEMSRLELYIELMLENYPDPLLLFDLEKKPVYTSFAYLRTFGLSEDSVVRGGDMSVLLRASGLEDILETVETMFETAVTDRRSSEIAKDIRPRGAVSVHHYQLRLSPMENARGEIKGVLAVFHDMTETVSARLEAERARELAEQSSRAKTDFLARISHEMRTPLNAIMGMTAVYCRTDDPRRRDDCIEKIGEASKQLLGVINDVLDMSKIEADKLDLTLSEFEPEELLRRIYGIMTFQADERGIRFSVDIGGGIPSILVGDEQRLGQVITNLLSNAFKFTPENGEVVLAARKIREDNESCTLRFSVRDSGIGIPKHRHSSLFLPFEQIDGGMSRKYGGTGLGLAISKRIVEMMRGFIWVESDAGAGSCFTFEVTADKAGGVNAPADPEQSGAAGGADITIPSFAGRRILLVDDVQMNREILIALLEETGAEIESAQDGSIALEKYCSAPEQYDLILMDIHMPEMDGYEATRRIRASGLSGAEDIPIIAMTANVFREDVERCLASGMNSHLGKPINIEDVMATIEAFLPQV